MALPTPIEAAPWKKQFAEHLERVGGPGAQFTLATVSPAGYPRARTCIFRGFWTNLRENAKSEIPPNPTIYESDCPTFTTDGRMSKVLDIFASGNAQDDLAHRRSGSGGGGPVEAVYFIRDTMTQWRIQGKCWLVAADDIEGEGDSNPNFGRVKAEVGRYMRPVGEHASKRSDWSWKREVENHFENMSPAMRGTFKNPPPGKPIIADGGETSGEALGQEAGHLRDEELARRNFRVCIITPEQVEQVDLHDPSRTRRWVYALVDAAEGQPESPEHSKPIRHWNVVEVWP